MPSASKPVKNNTIGGVTLGHESFYTYLRLRLPLVAGMVVVRILSKYYSLDELFIYF